MVQYKSRHRKQGWPIQLQADTQLPPDPQPDPSDFRPWAGITQADTHGMTCGRQAETGGLQLHTGL